MDDRLLFRIEFVPGCLHGAQVEPEDASALLASVGIAWTPGSCEAAVDHGVRHDGHVVGVRNGREVIADWTSLTSHDGAVSVSWRDGHPTASTRGNAPAGTRRLTTDLISVAAQGEALALPDSASIVSGGAGGARMVLVDVEEADQVHESARFVAALLSARGLAVTARLRLTSPVATAA